jgi:hypothetical protein
MAVVFEEIEDRPAMIRKLVGAGAVVDSTTEPIVHEGKAYGVQGRTPLTFASQYGILELVEVLLHLGADAAFPGPDGRPALPLQLAEENMQRALANIAKQEAEAEEFVVGIAELPVHNEDGSKSFLRWDEARIRPTTGIAQKNMCPLSMFAGLVDAVTCDDLVLGADPETLVVVPEALPHASSRSTPQEPIRVQPRPDHVRPPI